MHALDHQRLSHVHHIIITSPIHKLSLSIHDKLITNWHISHIHWKNEKKNNLMRLQICYMLIYKTYICDLNGPRCSWANSNDNFKWIYLLIWLGIRIGNKILICLRCTNTSNNICRPVVRIAIFLQRFMHITFLLHLRQWNGRSLGVAI